MTINFNPENGYDKMMSQLILQQIWHCDKGTFPLELL